MRFNPIRWSLAMVFVLFMLPDAYGQIGVLQGVVKDEEGKPIQDVAITIEGMEIKRTYNLKTDKRGKYLHAGIPLQGAYRITVKKEGFVSDGVQGVRAGFGVDDERGIHNFTLRKGESGKVAFELSEQERARMAQDRAEAEKKRAVMTEVQENFNLGIQLQGQGQFEQAIEAFKKAAEKDADQPAVWANLGNCHAKLKQYDVAIESYGKAIALKPADPGLYQNLGSIYAEMGNVEKSKEQYEKAASLAATADPKSAAVQFYNIGVTYINSGKNAEAAEALEKALAADATHAESHYQLGLVFLGLNKIEDAIAHLKKYVEIAPAGQNAQVAKDLIEQLAPKK